MKIKISIVALIVVSTALLASAQTIEKKTLTIDSVATKRILTLDIDGKVIGAIGVSGNSPQEDEDIAKAGADSAMASIKGGSK
jgi:uncharacterized protein GlcG (DUF336 family)